MKAIVWSKDMCPFCDKAKALLKLKNIEFEERNINKDYTKDQLMEAVPRRFRPDRRTGQRCFYR